MAALRRVAKRVVPRSRTFFIEVFRVSGSATIPVEAETTAAARTEALRIAAEGMLTHTVYLHDRPCGLLAASAQDVAMLDRMKRRTELED